MNTLSLQQLPGLLLPLVQYIVAALPPTLPPAVTFGANAVVRILQTFASRPEQELQHGPNRPMAMPAHLPELPPQEEWTPDGVRAWAERHAG